MFPAAIPNWSRKKSINVVMVYDFSTVKLLLVVDAHKLSIGSAMMVMLDDSLRQKRKWKNGYTDFTIPLLHSYTYLLAKIGTMTAKVSADCSIRIPPIHDILWIRLPQ